MDKNRCKEREGEREREREREREKTQRGSSEYYKYLCQQYLRKDCCREEHNISNDSIYETIEHLLTMMLNISKN